MSNHPQLKFVNVGCTDASRKRLILKKTVEGLRRKLPRKREQIENLLEGLSRDFASHVELQLIYLRQMAGAVRLGLRNLFSC